MKYDTIASGSCRKDREELHHINRLMEGVNIVVHTIFQKNSITKMDVENLEEKTKNEIDFKSQ